MSIFNKLFNKEKISEPKISETSKEDVSKIPLKYLFFKYKRKGSNEIELVYIKKIIDPKLISYGIEDITYFSDYICNALNTMYSLVENDRMNSIQKGVCPIGDGLLNIYLNRIFWFDKKIYEQYDSGAISFNIYMMIMKIIFDTVDDCKFTDQIAAEFHDSFVIYNQAKINRHQGAEPFLLQK